MPASVSRRAALRALDRLGMRVAARKQYHALKYWLDLPGLLQDRAVRRRGAPDGLPLPPPALVYLVVGVHTIRDFYENGALVAGLIKDVLARNSIDPAGFRAVLDFGCGCGRVTRHWATLGAKIRGCDYNPRLVEWCRQSLPFGEFQRNGLAPPLPYEAGAFDFAYAISVFTHLPESLQRPWMLELRRVLRPGGHIFFTVHGRSRVGVLPPALREPFDEGRLVTVAPGYAGTNVCGAYHPERFVREVLAQGFEVIDFIPGGPAEPRQDGYLLRKTAS